MQQQTKYDNFYTPENDEFYSKFQYVNIETTERRIRLLRIKPLKPGEDQGSQIHCELIDNQLLASVEGKFTTLSYCAGDPKKTETIHVNGLVFNVFLNLGHALRQVRHFWKRVYDTQELVLWADQVCINQSNLSERSHQVRFMGDIYSSSIQVLVCLSVEGDLSGGIRWLQQFAREFREFKDLPTYNEDDEDHVAHGLNLFREKNAEESFHHGWGVFLATVLQSPWWPRAWIRQEFIRSPNAYFLAVNEYLHWEEAAEAIELYYNAAYRIEFVRGEDPQTCPATSQRNCKACLHDNDAYISTFLDAGDCASKLLKLKKSARLGKPESRSLKRRLQEMHLCKASDPRDLVYACLGICSNGYGIYPDYDPNVSVQDVFIKVAQNIITHSKRLDILRHAYQFMAVPSHSDLPSWVPDWRNRPSFQRGSFNLRLSTTRAAKLFVFSPDSRGRPNRVLQVRGVFIAVIGSQSTNLWPKANSDPGVDWQQIVGAVVPGDEIYFIHGFSSLLVLHRQDEYFKVVGEVLEPDGRLISGVDVLVDELERTIEKDETATVKIKIC